MEPADFFESFNEVKESQPMVYLMIGIMKKTIGNDFAYIGFLRFFYIVWRCLETADARVRTQKLEIEDLRRNVVKTTQMLVYVGGSDDMEEINAVLYHFTLEHRQAALLSYVMGGIMSEDKIFPVATGVRYQIVTWLWGVITTFDEQMD